MLTLLLPAVIALFLYATGLFVLALRAKNNGIADIGYGGAFIVVVFTTLITNIERASVFSLALSLLVLIWGVRLGVRIYKKNRGKPEDFRYRAWRESWGRWFVLRSYLQIYLLQASIAFIIALPVTLALILPADVYADLALIGFGLWLFGFFFEVRGDYELDRFLHDPANKGKVMTLGLWRYTRHPNYFGESMMWWGIALASFAVSGAGLAAFVSPVLITYLLLFVSGIPMLERRFAGNPEWEAYKARTSAFIPLPPKR